MRMTKYLLGVELQILNLGNKTSFFNPVSRGVIDILLAFTGNEGSC